MLDRAKADQPEAWDRLVAEYAPAIYRWCRMDGIPGEDARDMTQDTLLAVFRRIQDFKKEGPNDTFRGWLRRIVRNRAIDYRRTLRRRRSLAVCSAVYRLGDRQDAMSESTSDSKPTDPRIAEFERVVERVRELSGDRSWGIFTHYVTDGFTAKETSKEFGVSEAYVYLVRARMLRRFRAEFEVAGRGPVSGPQEET